MRILLRSILMMMCVAATPFANAQHITLSQLMSLHSLGERPLAASLRALGWRDKGMQNDMPRKPRLFVILDGDEHPTQLYFYRSRNNPLCKLELVSDEVAAFNKNIRDSLDHYGFAPETDQRAPDEDNLTISSSAYFVNRDIAVPVHALVLYFERRGHQFVSFTVYSDR